MDLFPDGAFVRLRSSVHGTYLRADEDALGVSLRPERASKNAVWRVHRIVRNDIPLFLLHGTAYGRYLVTTLDPAPFGLRGRRVVQGLYDDQEQTTAFWSATKVARGNDEVLLQLVSDLRLLRANGKYFKPARTGVSVDSNINRSAMMHWMVEAVPPLPKTPPFGPLPPPAQAQPRRGIIGLFRKRAEPAPEPTRTVQYVLADEHGNFNDQAWVSFSYTGRCAYYLRNAVANRLNYEYFFHNMTICARPGRYGRLTPLMGELPRNQAPLDLIAVIYATPVETALRYPDVDADPNADTDSDGDAE